MQSLTCKRMPPGRCGPSFGSLGEQELDTEASQAAGAAFLKRFRLRRENQSFRKRNARSLQLIDRPWQGVLDQVTTCKTNDQARNQLRNMCTIQRLSVCVSVELGCGASRSRIDFSSNVIDREFQMPLANFLKRNSTLFAGALLVALTSSVAAPNPAPTTTPQQHNQVPGYYRMKVGDLEVTALFDGLGVFDPHWLKGKKATIDGIVRAVHVDPHMLVGSETGFLVNTGKRLILVDAGSGSWFGGGALGRMEGSLHSAGYTPEQVDLVLVTHLHSDHIGGLTTQDGKRVFPNAEVYVAKEDSNFWLSPEIAAKAPKDVQPFFQGAQAIAAPYIKAGKWHAFSSSEPIVDGMQVVPLHGHTPGHTGYEFSSKGQKILFWGDTIHAQRVQLQHPGVTVVFDIDPAAAAATRNQLLPRLAREDILIAGPHMLFPGLGRLHQLGSGYSWAPVSFTDQWVGK